AAGAPFTPAPSVAAALVPGSIAAVGPLRLSRRSRRITARSFGTPVTTKGRLGPARTIGLESRPRPLLLQRLTRRFRRWPQPAARKPHHHRIRMFDPKLIERRQQLV